ncbi:TonB-dependent receptor [Sphingomonas sp. ID0503]|uniref:TonB-dependent receptor n=1 Tax=Sphingomonas sp. ID0503 TaxID=3399691 RepID=UPI003AFA30CE
MAIKSVILGSASVISLVIGGTAFAQEVPAPGGVPQQEPSDGTPDTPEGSASTTGTPPSSDEGGSDDIVVTGVRASAIGAINSRKNNIQIVDSIVAEDVGKLPDNNVIEALQRVSGIQVTDRAGGETAAISIRGLSDPLTTLNGRNIFTGTGQSFSLQDVPANLVKKVDVFKTRSADQIETGLAGQIDVATRRPFDFDGFAISGIARGLRNEQADTTNPFLSGLISNRWETGIGDIGVMLTGAYNRQKFRNMSVTAGALVPFATETPPAGSGLAPLERIFPGGNNENWQPGSDRGLPTAPGSTLNINGVETPYYLSRDAVFSGDLYGKRERIALNGAVQWAPNDRSTYTAEVVYTGFRGQTFNSLMFSFVDFWGNLGPDPLLELYPDTNIVKRRYAGDVYGFNSGDFTKNKTDSWLYGFNAKWDIGERGKIVADVAYQDSKYQTQFFAMRTERVASGITADFNAGGGIPSYHFNDDSQLTDASVWNVAQLYDNGDKQKGSALTFTIDGEYTWDDGFLRRIRGGVRYDDRKAIASTRAQDGGILGIPLSELGEGSTFTNKNFFDGRADVPSSWVLPSGYWLWENRDAIRERYKAAFPGNTAFRTSDQLSYTDVFDINEITTAYYLMADGEVSIFGRPLRVQGGVRYVMVDTDFTFTDRYSPTLAQTSSTSGTEKWLPSATAIYEVTNRLRLRFNYGKTLRRPTFTDLNPNFNLVGDLTNVGYGSGTGGNASLRPTSSRNLDAAIEWYFDRDSAVAATFFHRKINGLVVPLTTRLTIPGSNLNTDSFLITRPENASNGTLKGVELSLTYFPKFLPGPLDGLGFIGSATILDSKQNIPLVDGTGAVVGETSSQFFGVSKLSYNATLAYDNGPIGARLSYVWRKEFLQRNEARLFANPIGVWRNPEKSLDLQLTYNISDRLGVTFDAVNLTKSKQQEYYQFEDAGGPDMFNLGTVLIARTFALGVKFNFD